MVSLFFSVLPPEPRDPRPHPLEGAAARREGPVGLGQPLAGPLDSGPLGRQGLEDRGSQSLLEGWVFFSENFVRGPKHSLFFFLVPNPPALSPLSKKNQEPALLSYLRLQQLRPSLRDPLAGPLDALARRQHSVPVVA